MNGDEAPNKNLCSNSAVHAVACCLGSPTKKRPLDNRRGTTRPFVRRFRTLDGSIRKPPSIELEISCFRRLHRRLISRLRISGWRKSVKQPKTPHTAKNREKRGTSRQSRRRKTNTIGCSDCDCSLPAVAVANSGRPSGGRPPISDNF